MKSNRPLNGLNILVTRPAHLAQPLCSMISTLGGTPYLFPTLEIVDAPDMNALQKAIKVLGNINLCIFTSQNAVIKSLPIIKHYWPTLPKQLQIAAIGEATALLLQQNKIPVTLCPNKQFNSESLLALPALQDIKNCNILIIKGAGGREQLTTTLTERGARIITAIAYRRQCPINTNLPVSLTKINIIVSTSSESLTNLWHMLAEKENELCYKNLVVISERMMQHAKKLGFIKIPLVAEEVSNQAIIDCLIRHTAD